MGVAKGMVYYSMLFSIIDCAVIPQYESPEVQIGLVLSENAIDPPNSFNTGFDKSFKEPNIYLPVLVNNEFESIRLNLRHDGTEKWATFLAVVESGKFKELIDKIKGAFGDVSKKEDSNFKEKGGQKDDKDGEHLEDQDIERDDGIAEHFDNVEEDDDISEANYTPHTNFKDINSFALSMEVDNMNDFFIGITEYWERENSQKIIESAATYDYNEILDFTTSGIQNNRNDQHIYNYKYEPHYESEMVYDIENPLASMNVTEINSTQREWLKENALRRSRIVQQLLNGESIDKEVEQDKIEYRRGNIFLDPDDNEFFVNSSNIKGTSMGLLIAVIVSEISLLLF